MEKMHMWGKRRGAIGEFSPPTFVFSALLRHNSLPTFSPSGETPIFQANSP